MDKKEHYGKSNNYLKESSSRRNHITRGDTEEQYQGAGSSERTKKEGRTSMGRQQNCLYKWKNLYSK